MATSDVSFAVSAAATGVNSMPTHKKQKKNIWLRIFLPAAVIIVWLGVAGVGGPYFGKIDEVSSNDLATFLPTNAESTKVKNELEKFQTADTLPVLVVFESGAKLTASQNNEIAAARDAMQTTGVVKGEAAKAIGSEDEKSAFIVVPLDANSEFDEVIAKLQVAVKNNSNSLSYKFTGPAMFARDLNKAFAGIDGTLLFVALGVVFLILLFVYRSPLLPIVTLFSAMIALTGAILVVWHLADAGILLLNGQVQGILFILVIGAATDYALLYISRYREELTQHSSKYEATKAAWKASWEPIVAAGGTVALGLLCLLVSDLGSNKALGPVGALGVAFSVLTTLTFLPATLLLLGRSAFWPRKPIKSPTKQFDYRRNHPAWARVGRLVSRHPRRLWFGITLVLVAACFFVPQFKAEGVSQSDLIVGMSEARDGQKMLDRHFPSGSGTPTYVLVPQAHINTIVATLEADKGVDTVSVLTSDANKSPAPLGKLKKEITDKIREKIENAYTEQLANIRAEIAGQMEGMPTMYVDQAYEQAIANIPTVDELVEKAYPFADVTPKVIDGVAVLQVTLNEPASSVAARDTVQRLRDATYQKYPEVLFGGVSAIQLDTNTAAEHDLRLIIPLILVAITFVLMFLLRSVVAPLILLVTTLLSFGATLGVAALLFNNVWKFTGADPAVVIFGFVFLVALGIDYNIFLMTRVREETIKHGVRAGTLKALVVTGGVITSAGIVLASTFAALCVIPILFLIEIAFVVAFGVLLDTLIVRSLLVPSITLQIGKAMWWPSKLWKNGKK